MTRQRTHLPHAALRSRHAAFADVRRSSMAPPVVRGLEGALAWEPAVPGCAGAYADLASRGETVDCLPGGAHNDVVRRRAVLTAAALMLVASGVAGGCGAGQGAGATSDSCRRHRDWLAGPSDGGGDPPARPGWVHQGRDDDERGLGADQCRAVPRRSSRRRPVRPGQTVGQARSAAPGQSRCNRPGRAARPARSSERPGPPAARFPGRPG
jgi:hypothetical protein